MRGANLPAARSEGPTLADLSSSGIKVETLQRLAPLDAEGDGGKGTLRQLIAYDQLTVRGEDLTGMYAIVESCDCHVTLSGDYDVIVM